MTAKIYSFEAAKKNKPAPQKEKKVTRIPSEIFDEVYADIVDEWQLAARQNRLNDLFASKLPSKAKGPINSDYVNDLNVISGIEQKLNLTLSINSPGFSGNKVGWLVIFKHGDEVYSGASDMILESYARAFNILLSVEFESRLKKLTK